MFFLSPLSKVRHDSGCALCASPKRGDTGGLFLFRSDERMVSDLSGKGETEGQTGSGEGGKKKKSSDVKAASISEEVKQHRQDACVPGVYQPLHGKRHVNVFYMLRSSHVYGCHIS